MTMKTTANITITMTTRAAAAMAIRMIAWRVRGGRLAGGERERERERERESEREREREREMNWLPFVYHQILWHNVIHVHVHMYVTYLNNTTGFSTLH